MSIIHIKKREHPYVQIDKRCLSDERLSWRARGILAYLLSKPDNWTVQVKDIENHGLEGRDAVQNALKELQKLGYANLETMQDEHGRLLGKKWVVKEEPTNGFSGSGLSTDELKNRLTEKPFNGKSAPTNNELNTENKFERDAPEKNSLSPSENSNVTLEAEKEKQETPAGAGGEPVTEPPTHRINLGDRPRSETPAELEISLRAFYTDWPNEWSVGIMENGRGAKYGKEKCREIVKDFCCWAIENGRGADTYRQLNAKLQGWFRNEQHTAWKQQRQQPSQETVYVSPKNAVY